MQINCNKEGFESEIDIFGYQFETLKKEFKKSFLVLTYVISRQNKLI